jgi:chorismate dehydratase
MRRLKISAISFLNTAPLMWDFEHPTPESRDVLDKFEFSYTVPSKCAQALQDGTADIGIIPSITFATIPGLAILPDVAIASKNQVRSILLVLNKPIHQVRTVALDTSSRTSVALTRILLTKFLPGPEREYREMDADPAEMLKHCDAGLLIGDAALRVDRNRYQALDLAEEWHRLTGKPFVFAFWAVRMSALADWPEKYELADVFCQSRDHGLEPHNIDRLGREWSPKIGLSEADIQTYLTENIHYYLDAENSDGLELFYHYAAELKLIPEAPALRLLGNAAFRLY